MTVKNKSFWWHLGNSLWVLLALVPTLQWLPFFLIGKWAKNKKYRTMGYVHLAISICLDIGFFTAIGIYCMVGILVQMLVVFVWALVERKDYLRQLSRLEAREQVENQLTWVASEEKAAAPAVSPEVPVQKLNVNSCTEEQLCALPGISVVEAKKMIALRDANGDFATVEEFIAGVGIKPHIAVRIVDNLYAEPTARVVEQKAAGRILDF